jgi:hypothetical protein
MPTAPGTKTTTEPEEEKEQDFTITYQDYTTPKNSNTPKDTITMPQYKGLEAFNKAFDEVIAEDKDAAKYRNFLTKIAEKESAFDSYVQNKAGAPAYGYFQFM